MMKKLVVTGIILLIAFGFAFAGGQQEMDEDFGVDQALTAEAFGDIEPLSEEVELVIGALSGAPHGFTNHLIQKLGGFNHANLDAEVVVFGNGPIMVEAMASGACDGGLYGLGGVIAGTLGQGIVNLGAGSRDYHGLMIFAPNDSPIVQAGQTLPEYPGLYGTRELWEGQDIFAPIGTTLYFTLIKGLDKFGLSADDIKVTHMTPENTNTALRAGRAAIGGLWGSFSYGDINETFTPVIRAGDVGVNLVTNYVTTEQNLKDPVRREAVKKWMELYFAAVEWMYATDANLNLATEWFLAWNEQNGIYSQKFDIEIMFEFSNCYSLEEVYEIANTPSENEDHSLLIDYSYDPMKFFVEMGNFTEEDLTTFVQPEFWDTSLVEELYAARK